MARRRRQETFKLGQLFPNLGRLNDDQKIEIGHKIIERIKERTDRGVDKRGKNFKKYSDLWAKKKGSSDVDMRLSGDMLDSIEIIKINGNEITIGWEDGLEVLKGENHINGVTVPKRDFLGLPKKDTTAIVKQTIKDTTEEAPPKGKTDGFSVFEDEEEILLIVDRDPK